MSPTESVTTETHPEPLLLPSDHHALNALELQPSRSRLSRSSYRGITERQEDGASIPSTTSARPAPAPTTPKLSLLQQVAVVSVLGGLNFVSSASMGLVEISLPTITKDLNIPKTLAFWPASVCSLSTASTLLLAGSMADVFSPRLVEILGAFGLSIFMLIIGRSESGSELVALRALQGVGYAMHLASSVALTTRTLERGRGRNIAFATLGVSSVAGFSFGLVIGGVLIDSAGWRTGWYLLGGTGLALSLLGAWSLPKTAKDRRTWKQITHDMREKVDWVGAFLASAFMALLSYLLAVLSTNILKIKNAESIVLLCLSAVLGPLFVYWMHFQVKRQEPALIPNYIWKDHAFASMCAIIGISYAVCNAMELFAGLYFQQVQSLSPLQAGIRILPSLIVGTAINFVMGFFVDRFPPLWIVVISSLLNAGSPMLMAICQPHLSYWTYAFVAQLLLPVSFDVVFTVGLIIITDVFPEDTQAMAGAVFNTVSQFAGALGLAILQVVSSLVSQGYEDHHEDADEAEALLQGYRAGFWTMFGFMLVCAGLSFLGLRKKGRVGLKED